MVKLLKSPDFLYKLDHLVSRANTFFTSFWYIKQDVNDRGSKNWGKMLLKIESTPSSPPPHPRWVPAQRTTTWTGASTTQRGGSRSTQLAACRSNPSWPTRWQNQTDLKFIQVSRSLAGAALQCRLYRKESFPLNLYLVWQKGTCNDVWPGSLIMS